jgi:hypothetical protein
MENTMETSQNIQHRNSISGYIPKRNRWNLSRHLYTNIHSSIISTAKRLKQANFVHQWKNSWAPVAHDCNSGYLGAKIRRTTVEGQHRQKFCKDPPPFFFGETGVWTPVFGDKTFTSKVKWGQTGEVCALHSTTWVTPLVHFALLILEMGSWELFADEASAWQVQSP